MATSEHITAIECPTGVGATFHGLSRGPAALLSAGILDKLNSINRYTITSRRPFEPIEGTIGSNPNSISINGIRDEELAVDVNRKIKREILAGLSGTSKSDATAATSPPFQLILGGVCTMMPAIVSGLMEALPTRKIGIIWFDADADLSLPEEIPPGTSGIVACMAFSQMIMRKGALQSMKEFSAPIQIYDERVRAVSGEVKGVSNPTNTVLFGLNTTHASVVPREHLTYLIDEHYRIFSSKGLSTSVEHARLYAAQALEYLSANGCDTIIVHVDVDAIDAREFPLGNIPNMTGLSFEGFKAALDVFIQDQRVRGLTLTEMNPDRDTGLVMTTRLVDGVVESFRQRAVGL